MWRWNWRAAGCSNAINLDTLLWLRLWAASVLVVIWVTWLEHLFNGPISGGNFSNCLISPPGVGLRQIQEARRHIITFSASTPSREYLSMLESRVYLFVQCYTLYWKGRKKVSQARWQFYTNVKINWVIHFRVWISPDFISRLHECQYHKTRSSKRKLKC